MQGGAIVKSLFTTLALTALSVIAVQAIERYGNKTFTPFQKGGAGLLAIPVYLFVSTRFFPWHKPATSSQPSSDRSRTSESDKTSSTIALQDLIGKGKTSYEYIRDQINRCQTTELILTIANGGRGQWANLKIDLSTKEKREEALQHCEDKIASFPSEPVRPLSVDTISPPGPSQPLPKVNLQDLPKQTKRIYQCLQKKIPTYEQPYMMVSLKTNDQSENEIVDLDLSNEEKKQAALKYCQQQLNSLTPSQPSKNEVNLVLSRQNGNADDIEIERVLEEEVEVSVSAPYQATYNSEVHGMNGSFMRERYFDALLKEIKRGVESVGTDIAQTLEASRKLEDTRQKENKDKLWLFWSSSTTSYLIIMLEALEPDSKRTAEERYGALVQAHRQLLYLKDNSAPCTAFIEARMTPKMQVFQESYVGEFLGKHGRKLTLANFSDEFTQRNKAVKKAPKEMKMDPGYLMNGGTLARQACGALSWENYFSVNPPNHLETITLMRNGISRNIEYIREPTPHIASTLPLVTSPGIDPTFEAYLKILDQRNQSFLYSAHQRLKDQKSGFSYAKQCEIEDHRSQGLIELEKRHPNFLLIFQSVENDLFKEASISIADLKAMIKKSFTDPEGCNQNRLPRCLQNHENYANRMDTLLDLVQTVFFSGVTEDLSPKDRESFILYFYALQRLDLMTGDYLDDKPVAAMTTPCKDFYDRGLGQALMTRIMNLVLIYGKSGIPSAKLEEIANAGQFPPLLGKGLPAIEHRFGPACEAIEHLSTVNVEPLREFDFNGWKVNGTTVHRQEGQSAASSEERAV